MAKKLDWDYCDRSSDSRTTYRGLTIRAVPDMDPENPFESWDGNWPIIVRSPDAFRSFVSYDIDGKAELQSLCAFEEMNDAQIVHDQFTIAEILGWTGPERIAQIMEAYVTEDPVRYCHDADALRDAFVDAFNDRSASEMLGVYAQLLEIAGVPCLLGTTHGYSQGDSAEILVIASRAAQAKFGTTSPPKPEDLQGMIDLYGAWAWGDVYGYIVEDNNETQLDSCWGYYGQDFAASGLEEAATNAVDCIVEAARRRRIAALRTVIVNRVPIAHRPAILARAGELAHA